MLQSEGEQYGLALANSILHGHARRQGCADWEKDLHHHVCVLTLPSPATPTSHARVGLLL